MLWFSDCAQAESVSVAGWLARQLLLLALTELHNSKKAGAYFLSLPSIFIKLQKLKIHIDDFLPQKLSVHLVISWHGKNCKKFSVVAVTGCYDYFSALHCGMQCER